MEKIPHNTYKNNSVEMSNGVNLHTDYEFCFNLLTRNNGYLNNLFNAVLGETSIQNFLRSSLPGDNPVGNEAAKCESLPVNLSLTKRVSKTSRSMSCPEHKPQKHQVENRIENGAMTPRKEKEADANSEAGSTGARSNTSGSQPARADSNLRKDVVYKTILRAIRRFYTKLFKERYPLRTKRCSQKPTIATQINAVEVFCQEVFQESGDVKSIMFFVMIMINQKLFNQAVKTGVVPPNVKRQAEEMYACLYSFKMGKFKQIATNKYVRILMSTMLSYGKEAVIQSEKAMSDNAETYLEAFKQFFKIK